MSPTYCPECGAFLLASGEGYRCAGCLYRSPEPRGQEEEPERLQLMVYSRGKLRLVGRG